MYKGKIILIFVKYNVFNFVCEVYGFLFKFMFFVLYIE